MIDDDLGPLLARVPEVLRGSGAYHVAQPPRVIAKLDANELPYGFPPELRQKLATALSEVALERYPDPNARRLRALLVERLNCEMGVDVTGEQLVFGNGSDELIALLANAFAGPILTPAPSFVYYKLAAIARGLPIIEYDAATAAAHASSIATPASCEGLEGHGRSAMMRAREK